jgi:hypothetical protein
VVEGGRRLVDLVLIGKELESVVFEGFFFGEEGHEFLNKRIEAIL